MKMQRLGRNRGVWDAGEGFGFAKVALPMPTGPCDKVGVLESLFGSFAGIAPGPAS